MKRKIILFLILALAISCLMAICAGAKTVISENNLDENGDIVADFQYLVEVDYYYCTVDITYNDVNGNQKSGQFVYKTGGIYRGMLQIIGVYVPNDFDFSQTIYLFDKVDANGDGSYGSSEYLKGSNGGTNAMHWHSYESFDGKTGTFSSDTVDIKSSVTTISYSKYMTYFGHYFMPCADSLTTVTYNGKEPVSGTFFVSATINEIMSNTFGGEGNNSGNIYEPNYKRLVFEEREGSVSMQQYSFCRTVIEEVVFLGGEYYMRGDSIAFAWKQGTTEPSLKSIVLAPDVSINLNNINWNVGTYDIVYIGTENQYNAQIDECKITGFSNTTGVVTYEDICYVYGHKALEHDGLCTSDVVCGVCDDVLEKALYEDHDVLCVAKYEKGYGEDGYKVTTCSRCVYNAKESLEPLFKCLGYSAPENGGDGIAIGFTVNNIAIKEYEEITGKSVNYGVFVVLKDKLGGGDIFDAKGNAIANAVTAEVSNDNYVAVELKITGFTDEYKDVMLAMGAYVKVTDGENTEYSYIQGKTPNENENYFFVSYNGVANPTVSDKEVA